jgi:hypothetical protein
MSAANPWDLPAEITMRYAAFLSLFLLAPALGQEKLAKRYGFEANTDFYPQKTPQEALASAVKTIENKRVDYLLAQLADPKYVDDDAVRTFLAFDRLVKETGEYYLEDPTMLKELRLFVKEGEWESGETQASAAVKTIQGRKVFLKKVEDRWFLENRQQ